jgi:transmembrane sensor
VTFLPYSYYMKITRELINRYLKNQCSAEEAAYLEDYIAHLGESLDQLLSKEEWDLTDENLDYPNQQEIKDKILAFAKKQNVLKYNRKLLRIASAAAAIIIFIFGFYVNLNPLLNKPAPHLGQIASVEDEKEEVSNLYYINSGNDNMLLTASDGSVITLYPQSEIKYAEDFSTQQERVLYLKGKAKFEVAKDKSKPFRVHSTGVVTTALGTVFSVDELRSTQTQIKLMEGKIEVKAVDHQRGKELVRTFLPHEEITLDHRELKVVEEIKTHTIGTDRGGHFLQNNQIIQFKNIALEDVLTILMQNYDIKLQYDKSLIINKFYSGTFTNKTNVFEEIIREINYLHHAGINYTNPQ